MKTRDEEKIVIMIVTLNIYREYETCVHELNKFIVAFNVLPFAAIMTMYTSCHTHTTTDTPLGIDSYIFLSFFKKIKNKNRMYNHFLIAI